MEWFTLSPEPRPDDHGTRFVIGAGFPTVFPIFGLIAGLQVPIFDRITGLALKYSIPYV